jgi:transcriptional regulator with GAF, ATPase, and Fis domain
MARTSRRETSRPGGEEPDPQQTVADLKRALAERTAERDEAMEQQTATAEVLGVINSSPGDLAPVFDAILEKALQLCGAAHGHVFSVDGERVEAVAAQGDPDFVDWVRQRRFDRPGIGVVGRMIRGEDIVQIADSRDGEGYRTNPQIREIVDRSGVRITLGIALRKDGSLLGAIVVNRREVRPFSEKQITLLQSFAAQAVIAMENARLITETREALDQQTATSEVLQVITHRRATLCRSSTICCARSLVRASWQGAGAPAMRSGNKPNSAPNRSSPFSPS